MSEITEILNERETPEKSKDRKERGGTEATVKG